MKFAHCLGDTSGAFLEDGKYLVFSALWKIIGHCKQVSMGSRQDIRSRNYVKSAGLTTKWGKAKNQISSKGRECNTTVRWKTKARSKCLSSG